MSPLDLPHKIIICNLLLSTKYVWFFLFYLFIFTDAAKELGRLRIHRLNSLSASWLLEES